MKNSGTNKNIFLQFVLTYCIIILLMLVCLLPIFLSLQRLETEKAVSQLEEYARSAAQENENLDTVFFSTARSFYRNAELKAFYYNEDLHNEKQIFYHMTRIQEELKLQVHNISGLRDVFVYIPKFDYVLSTQYIFRGRYQFYDYYKSETYLGQDWLP